ncbi:MAG TPA: asparaginase [Chloroflexia bacterium]|jgi:L-asparaginase|nr:asparaginase [Chloroflexia bacterium]
MRPKVTVISLGGTIAMTTTGGGGVTPTLDGATLVSAVPGLGEVAELTAVSFRQLPSAHLGLEDVLALASEVVRHIDGGAGGVVITQGTDTLEEVAFALDLLLDREAPVVVTGAMRNPTLPGADGPANLLAAVRVAASPQARDLGVLVVLDDQVHSARYVQKTHTTGTAAFRSPLAGPLGWVVEGRVRVNTRPVPRPRIQWGSGSELPPVVPVALLTVSLGDDGRLVDLVRQAGYGGLVIEAFGAGHVHVPVAYRLKELAAVMPVVLASRTRAGDMLRHTYAFRGSETDLLSSGLISAGPLDGPKARVLLSLLLTIGADREQIAGTFAVWAGD